MKPQARPFTVEIKRSRRPNSSGTVLPSSSSILFDHPIPNRPGMNVHPEERGRDAAPDSAFREAERVFSRSAATRVVAPILDGADPQKNADSLEPAQFKAESTSVRPDVQLRVGAKPRSGRVHPDLLSAAREEERAREAQELVGVRRIQRGTRRPAQPKAPQPEERRREERASSGRGRKAVVGLGSPGELVPPSPDVATLAEQQATVMPIVDQALSSPKPGDADRRNSGGRFRRKVERTSQTTSLRAGERWKRRLPPVCR